MRYIYSVILGTLFQVGTEMQIWGMWAHDLLKRAPFLFKMATHGYWRDTPAANGEVYLGFFTASGMWGYDLLAHIIAPLAIAAGLFFLLIKAPRFTKIRAVFIHRKRTTARTS
jgi:hypothetical protein